MGALLAVTRSAVIRKSSTSSRALLKHVCECVLDRGEFPYYKRIKVSDGRVIGVWRVKQIGNHHESVLTKRNRF